MAVNSKTEDNRIRVIWSGPVTPKFYGELYSAARQALIDEGKGYLATQMWHALQPGKVKSQSEGIKVMKRYVDFR